MNFTQENAEDAWNVCRTCLSESAQDMTSLFDEHERLGQPLAKILQDFIPLKFDEIDGLSRTICQGCVQETERILLFRKCCTDSDAQLRRRANNLSFSRVNILRNKPELSKNGEGSLLLNGNKINDNNKTDVDVVINNEEFYNDSTLNCLILPEENGHGLVNIKKVELNDSVKYGKQEIKGVNKNECFVTEEFTFNDVKNEVFENEFSDGVSHDEDITSKGKTTEIRVAEDAMKKIYSCRYCDYNSKSKKDVGDHRKLVHNEKKALKKVMKKNKNIYMKEIDAEGNDVYKCSQCDYVSHEKKKLFIHHDCHHPDVKEIIKREKATNKYTKDIDANGTNVYKCVQCEYVTHARSNLLMHHKSHYGDKPFRCESCPFKSNFRASLQAHVRIHTGEKPFLCDKCDLRFKQLAHLKQHRLTHSAERPWSCGSCGYRAKAKRHLDNHLRTHTGEKPFMCDLCSFTCASHVNLLSHQRSHSDVKTYRCELCSYASNFKKNLSMHAAKHSGVRAFLCPLCEYRGTCAQNLRAHMISHSQERPFACVSCPYRTKTNSMLNKHLKTHVRA